MFTLPCLAKCKGKIGCPDDAHGMLSLFFTFVRVLFPKFLLVFMHLFVFYVFVLVFVIFAFVL